MIHKNTDFQEAKNVTNVEFGRGTLELGCILFPTEGAVILIKSIEEPQLPIGKITNVPRKAKEFAPDIVLQFNNRESLEVLQDYINECRAAWDKPDTEYVQKLRKG